MSEIMLQQTGTRRVEGKYREFLKAFPTVHSLSRASAAEVLRIWNGLGYSRRALSILKAARLIVTEHGGQVPRDQDRLRELPGVGAATAGAIQAFAYGMPSVFLETNIRRVFLHFFFPGEKDVKDSEIMPLIRRTLDRSDPREWYFALMDYGAMLAGDVANPNRRSAHYARQPRFEGSRRQLRGKILNELLRSESLGLAGLCRATGADSQEMEYAVRSLVDEGFLSRRGAAYRLRTDQELPVEEERNSKALKGARSGERGSSRFRRRTISAERRTDGTT